MKNKTVSDILYSQFHLHSYYLSEYNKRIFYKQSNAEIYNAIKYQIIPMTEEIKERKISIRTISNYIKLFKELELITEETIKDKSGNEKVVYVLKDRFALYTYIDDDTLDYLFNVSSTHTIKVYAYLLNQYGYYKEKKHNYTFTAKALIKEIGYNEQRTKIITDILEDLKLKHLIDYKINYRNVVNNCGKPTPRPYYELLAVNSVNNEQLRNVITIKSKKMYL